MSVREIFQIIIFFIVLTCYVIGLVMARNTKKERKAGTMSRDEAISRYVIGLILFIVPTVFWFLFLFVSARV